MMKLATTSVLVASVITIIYGVFLYFSENLGRFIWLSIITFFILIFLIIYIFLHFYNKLISKDIHKNITSKEEKILQNTQDKTEIPTDIIAQMENYRKEYIGNISHEMKTPLFSIQGYLDTIREGDIEENVRDRYLERIGFSVERLINIVKDLDFINRFEAGEIMLDISNFNLNHLVKEVFEILEIEVQKKNAKLILNTDENDIYVKADKQKISQVLINLLSNAIHYSNRDQAKISVTLTSLNHKIYVEVEDNGMGIKPEALPRVFERFYRVESSRSRREGGSGLGLAIVKYILEAHNENIYVESEYLEGTKFSFLLSKA